MQRPNLTLSTEPVTTEPSYLGIGLYSIQETARILRTPTRTVHNWAKGYTFSRNAESRTTQPLVMTDYPALADENILTFVDLVEMHVVRTLRNHGVPMRTIKIAALRLKEKAGTNHPFAVGSLSTDGKRIFHADENGIEQLAAYQLVMGEIIQGFLKMLDYENDHAARLWPIGHNKIVLDPKRSFGRPIVYKGGVPTYAIHQMRLAGETVDRLASWWEIPISSVENAIEYEELLAA